MEIIKLGEICEIISGKKPNKNLDSFLSNSKEYGLPFPKQSDIKGYLLKKTELFFNKQYYKLTKIDDGKGLYFLPDANPKPFLSEIKFCMSPSIWKLKCYENIISKKYFYYWLINNKNKINMLSHGTTIQHISKEDFKKLLVYIPDMNIQQQIIDTIEPFEKLKENYWNKINSLLRIISSIKINKEKKFYLKNHTEMLRNKKHNIHQVSAKVLNKQNPIVNDFEKENTYKTNTFFCEKNTLIINTIRTYLRKFCILPKDSDVTGTMVQLVVKDKHTSILNNLLNDSFWEQAVKLSKGTKMPQISVDSLLNSIKLYECNIEIKNLFNYITNMNNVILYIEKIINNLISLYIKD